MRRRKRSSKKTLQLCHYRDYEGKCCFNAVKWKLEVIDTGVTFCVCAEHLDWGLTYAGTPAELDTQTKRVKVVQTEEE